MDVQLNEAELHELAKQFVRDVERRGENVRREAARRARGVSRKWAAAMATETHADTEGTPYVDIGWRYGTGAGEEWRGHFFLFGTRERNHPPHLDVLLGSLDEAMK